MPQISTILTCFGARISAEIEYDIKNIANLLIRPIPNDESLVNAAVSLHKFMFFCNLLRAVSGRLTAIEELKASRTIRIAGLYGEISSI
jgi:hypothetical protein